MKSIFFAVLFCILFPSVSFGADPCAITEPAELYKFQDEILALPSKVKSAEELSTKIQTPLRCLSEAHLTGEDLLTKYVAGACLQRLMGAPEILGLKKTGRYKIIQEALLNMHLASTTPWKKSEIADLANGKWSDYVTFCKGIKDMLCGEFLPTNDRIKDQNELLGATSMLLLKSAFLAFKGQAKTNIAKQIRQLNRETPQDASLKRKVIDQILREIEQSEIELRGS